MDKNAIFLGIAGTVCLILGSALLPFVMFGLFGMVLVPLGVIALGSFATRIGKNKNPSKRSIGLLLGIVGLIGFAIFSFSFAANLVEMINTSLFPYGQSSFSLLWLLGLVVSSAVLVFGFSLYGAWDKKKVYLSLLWIIGVVLLIFVLLLGFSYVLPTSA